MLAQRVEVAHVGLDGGERLRRQLAQPRHHAGVAVGVVVEDDGDAAGRREGDDHVRADVAGAAGDEDG